jgi:hypothetical protein
VIPVRREVVFASPALAAAALDTRSRIAVADYYLHALVSA